MPLAPQISTAATALFRIQPKRFRQPRAQRVCQLRRQIEAVRHEGRRARESRLDLVGDRKTGQKFLAGCANVLAGGEDGPYVVRRMAKFLPGQIAVHEVEIANQRRLSDPA